MKLEGHELQLSKCGYESIKDDMLTEGNYSFHRQMYAATVSGVQAVLCTAKSAIPIADAVRGFYDGLELPRPRLGFVRADSRIVATHVSHRIERRVDEVQRLQPLLADVTAVAIIDQFIFSGATIGFADEIVKISGVEHSQLIRGKWYHEGGELVNMKYMTSPHAEFMYSVGQAAAALCLES